MAKKRPVSRRTARAKVKVALIGAGGMANIAHYPCLKEIKEAQLVALCDLDSRKLKETVSRFGIDRTFTDYREMIEKTKPHAVYALMPATQVFDVARNVLEMGRHLFIEKPPAATAFQASCLARRAEELGLVTGVGFQRRYHPLFRRCLKEVNRLGPPQLVVATFYKNMPPSQVHPYSQTGTDILTSDAIHALDAARFYAGGKVVDVQAEVRKLDCWYPSSFTAILKFDNGCTGVFVANWRCGARRLKLELHSHGASAYASDDGVGEVFRQNERVLSLSHVEAAGSELWHHHQGFFEQTRDFIRAVRTGRAAHNNFTDAARTMRLVERVYRAAGEFA